MKLNLTLNILIFTILQHIVIYYYNQNINAINNFQIKYVKIIFETAGKIQQNSFLQIQMKKIVGILTSI